MPISEVILDTEGGPKRIEFKNCKIVLNDPTFGRIVYRHSGYPNNRWLPLYDKEEAITWCKREGIPLEEIVRAFNIDVD